jgi:hypothetical protein
MQSLRAKIIKWKRGKSTSKNTRNDENSAKLFHAIYENNFEMAEILLEDGEVDVNIKDDCGFHCIYCSVSMIVVRPLLSA